MSQYHMPSRTLPPSVITSVEAKEFYWVSGHILRRQIGKDSSDESREFETVTRKTGTYCDSGIPRIMPNQEIRRWRKAIHAGGAFGKCHGTLWHQVI
jgi:hypothetical protein